LIIAGLFGLILGGELLLPVIEEVGLLALEWAHKTLDILYEDVLGFGDEASKKASAYTGLLLIIALLVWVGYKLHQKYLRTKAVMSQWWASLTWLVKLLYIAGGLVLIGILAMFI
jgi:hypothetical protein